MVRYHNIFICLVIGLLVMGSVFGSSALYAENLTITLEAGEYEIIDVDKGQQVIKMEDFGNLLVPGKPMLPARCFMIALPPGAEVLSVATSVADLIEVHGRYQIKPAPTVLPSDNREEIVKECRRRWQNNYDITYSSDKAYPGEAGMYLGTGGLRKYTFVRVGYSPFSHYPQSGRLVFRPSLTVSIDYNLSSIGGQEYKRLLSDTKGDRLASRLLVNYSQAEEWYRPVSPIKSPKESYDYVVITTDALTTAVSPLVSWKETIGYSANVVTTSWIESNYTGSDLQEKIRNFLSDKYMEWGIEYVLLAGDIDVIPMRQCYPNPSDHDPDSWFCTPTDYYYADLTGDWDADGDGYHGEYEEDSLDFVPELSVGRIPFSDAPTVTSICEKLVSFEGDTSSWKNNALLLGAMSNYANEDFSGLPRTDGAVLMETMISNMLTGWSYTTMYEKEGLNPCPYACDYPLTRANVTSNWSSNDYGIVNWWSHGDFYGAYRKWWESDNGNGVPEGSEMSWELFIGIPDISSLDDDHPSIIFCCACDNGEPELDNLAKTLLEHGSAGIVASTRVSWYNEGWEDELSGGNASLDYFFYYYMIVEGERVGDALFSSKVYYLNYLFWSFADPEWSPQHNMLSFCLYGDPALVRGGITFPHIVSTAPVQNELNVPVSTNISVTFDVDMDQTTINDSTFVVNARSTGLHAGTITYDGPSRTATFDPAEDFDEGEVVTVALTTGVKSYDGTPLEGAYVWSFTSVVYDGPGTFPSQSLYTVGQDPTSVFSADLDGDGDLDLAAANSHFGTVSVLLNNGDGTFAPHSFYYVGSNPYSVFSSDLDGDGDLDLATANWGSDNVSVLLNNGDGTFATQSLYAVGQDPESVFSADLDGDGDLDLATANINSDDVSVLLNNGDGTFATHSVYAVGSGPYSVFSSDLDGDGDLDLAVANYFSNNVSVLLNNGDGTFATQSLYTVGQDPVSVFCADLDGDGDLDLAAANSHFGTVSVLPNNGDGTFAPHSFYYVGTNPYSVFSSDLDGDGDLDLATANWSSDNVSVLLNNGDGTFAPQSVYAVGDEPLSVFSADLDGDGNMDLATANYGSGNVSVLLNRAQPHIVSTSPAQNELNVSVSTNVSVTFDVDMDETTINDSTFVVNARSTGMHAGTITYDGPTKTATFDPVQDFDEGEVVTMALTTGLQSYDGTPLDSAHVWSFTLEVLDVGGTFVPDSVYPVGDGPHSVFSADLDGDGDLDLVAANDLSASVSVLLNNGDGTFAPQSVYAVGDLPYSVFSADLDADGDLDLATANAGTENVSVLLNNGDGSFATHLLYPVGGYPSSVFSADLDGDGDLDLAVANNGTHNVSVLLNNGDGTFATHSLYPVGTYPWSVFSADLDGDGNLDLATANGGSDNVSVLLNNGDGTFATDSVYAVGVYPVPIFSADLDGDGDLDLAAANYGSDNVSVLLNYGDGTFAAHSLYPVGETPNSVFSADLDGDGDLDLATANWDSDNFSVLLNNGDGTFAPHSVYAAGDAPASVFSADLDGDGDLDLAAANFWSNNVSVLLNTPKPHVVSTSPAQNELNVPLSTNISVTFDIDMDETTMNDSTFVVNARSTGMHTGTITYDGPSRTATFDPAEDFDEGEVVTVALTAGIQSSEGVALDSAYVWSFTSVVEDGSGTFAPHSVYPVGDYPFSVFSADLDGDGNLDLAVANLNSDSVSVLLNNGDGTFATQSLYEVGQDPRSVFSADLDGDGDLDLTTANQYFGTVSVLLNNGDGTFAPQSVYQGGDSPYSVFSADLDGDGDLDLATANSTSSIVSVLLNNGDGSFAYRVQYAVDLFPFSIFSADLDGDGDLDMAVANFINRVSVLMNKGDGTFAPYSFYLVGSTPYSVFSADLDGDGDLDLATANFNSDDVSVLLNNGDGTFAPHSLYAAGGAPNTIFSADLDGDGDLDLVTANYDSDNVSVLLNNGDGTFTPQSVYPAGDGAASVFAADLDGDGDMDLATANQDSDNISVLLNQPAVICGDANDNEAVEAGDVVYLISYLFRSGPAPDPMCVGDANLSGTVEAGDVVYLISYLFRGGPAPSPDCCAKLATVMKMR